MAVAEELVVQVTAKFDDAVKNLQKVEKQTGLTFKAFLNLIPGPLKAAASITGLIAIGKDLVSNFQQQEAALASLKAAMLATGEYSDAAINSFSALASELQKVTTYGDETTISAIAMIRQLTTLDNDTIKSLIPRVQDFASAMGMDLNQAALLIAKSIGTDTNALSRYGITLKEGATEQEKLSQITETLTNRFDGMAVAMGQTSLGEMQKMKNALGDLKEIGGEAIADFLLPFVKGLADFATTTAETVAALRTLSKELTDTERTQTELLLERKKLELEVFQAKTEASGQWNSYMAQELHWRELEIKLLEEQLRLEKEAAAAAGDGPAGNTSGIEKTTKAYGALKETITLTDSAINQIDKSAGALADTTKSDWLTSINAVTDGMQAYADSLTMTIPTMEELAATEQMWMDIDKERADALIESREEEAAKLDELKEKYADYYTALGDGLADAATALTEYAKGEKTAAEAAEALKEIAKESAVAVLKAIGEEAIAKAALYTAAAFLGDPSAAAAAIGYGVAGVTAYAGAGIVAGLADGGVVQASPGGSVYRIGEGGSDEAVIPLDKYNIGGNTTVNNIFGTIWQEKQITREIAKRSAYANRRY